MLLMQKTSKLILFWVYSTNSMLWWWWKIEQQIESNFPWKWLDHKVLLLQDFQYGNYKNIVDQYELIRDCGC